MKYYALPWIHILPHPFENQRVKLKNIVLNGIMQGSVDELVARWPLFFFAQQATVRYWFMDTFSNNPYDWCSQSHAIEWIKSNFHEKPFHNSHDFSHLTTNFWKRYINAFWSFWWFQKRSFHGIKVWGIFYIALLKDLKHKLKIKLLDCNPFYWPQLKFSIMNYTVHSTATQHS